MAFMVCEEHPGCLLIGTTSLGQTPLHVAGHEWDQAVRSYVGAQFDPALMAVIKADIDAAGGEPMACPAVDEMHAYVRQPAN
jgi:hypothetical protein